MVLGAPANEPLPSPSDNPYFPPIRNRELKKTHSIFVFLLFCTFHQGNFVWGRGDIGVFAFWMSYQPIHLVSFLDLDGVAEAERPQEQLLTALGRRDGGLSTSLVPRTQPTSQCLHVIFAYARF